MVKQKEEEKNQQQKKDYFNEIQLWYWKYNCIFSKINGLLIKEINANN